MGRLLVLFLLAFALACLGQARLQAQGQDTTFVADVYGGLQTVNGAAIRPDGKVVIWGNFTNIGPATPPSTEVLNNIGVLNSDGTPNYGFVPSSGANNSINCVAIQTDGRLIVGGNFTTMNGVTQKYLCRLNTDGSLDTSFTPTLTGSGVNSVAIQSNGQIIAAGSFTSVTGSSQVRITRLNTDGSLDTTFSQTATANNQINSVFVDPQGNILLGGAFTSVNGTSRNHIARLTSEGLIDSTFNPGNGPNGAVSCLLLQTDGSIVLAGSFTSVSGTGRTAIARLSSTGSLDTTFNPNSANSSITINSMALQADGKLLITGNFTVFDGASHASIVRLTSAGAIDTSFSPPSFGGPINGVALQNNGSIVVGGQFSLGESLLVARLNNSTATTTLSVTAPTTVTWSRSNACPEVWNTTFELSTDGGNTWNSLGSVSRISGGWQLTGLSLPSSGLVRARAQATAGLDDGSQELVEQLVAFGGASQQPVANATGATPTATVPFQGSTNVTYGATLTGTVNALGNSTTVTMQYGLTPSYGFVVTPAQSPLGGSTLTSVSAALTGLQPGTTYHYRVKAVSSAGTTFSGDSTFTTLNNVDTFSSLSVTDGSPLAPTFTVNNNPRQPYTSWVSANATSATIDFGTSDPNATVTVNGVAQPAGTTSAVVSLSPGTNTINIVVTASNGVNTITYPLTIDTAIDPTATAQPPDVADVYAVLRVQGVANDDSATVTFQYGPDTNYGSTVSGPAISGGTGTNSWQTITGLTPGATYHYQATVTNSAGTAVSADQSFTTYLTPPAGSIDSTFSATTTKVQTVVTQPNGQIVIGGSFTTVDGVPANGVARLNANGTLDTSFAPSVTGGPVYCLAVQPDGKILVGGDYTNVNGVTTNINLVRLNTDGSLDTAFAPNPNGEVACLAIQPNGQIIAGGYFSTISGSSQGGLARLNTDGSLDSSFAPSGAGPATNVAIQPNGQLMVSGLWTEVDGVSPGPVVRMNSDGSLDSGFAMSANSVVNSVAVLPDGQYVIVGAFNAVNGTACNYVARLNTDGSLDTTFNPSPNGPDAQVYTVALQTDGHILLGGTFSNVSGVSRRHAARLNSDGSLDPVFNPDVNSTVNSIAAQANGEVLIGGTFLNVFGQTANCLALVLNDPAAQAVSVPDQTQIQWARGGSEPEANTVTFDLSTDGGNTFTSLGAGTRVTGGWQLTGLSLPPSGSIRARAYSSSGLGAGSSSIIEQDWIYPAPQIVVQEPAGTALVPGSGTINFGQLLAGNSATQTFTIVNSGDASMTNLAVTLSGGNANDFSLITPPATTLAAGGNTTFTVQFTPSTTSAESATLQLASNVTGGNNPFAIILTGAGITQLQNWRLTWFGTTSNTGNAADMATPENDGIANLLKFATGLNPTQTATPPGQLTLRGNNLIFTYQRSDAAVAAGLNCVVEWTDTLQSPTWSSTGVTETVLSDNGTIQQVQDVIPVTPNSPCFVHLRVWY
jgi:uncharacterized delta-60 repeat protein